MNEQLVERTLTAIEIKERQSAHLGVLSEIDNFRDEVAEHRRCVKENTAEIERLEQRERQLRRELRSGTVFESRQRDLGFSLEHADTERERPKDPPDPPPAPEQVKCKLCGMVAGLHHIGCGIGAPELVDRFAELYPMVDDIPSLRLLLVEVLTPELGEKLDPLPIPWHPRSGIFDAVAHWARIEKAHLDAPEGVTLPARLTMPEKLTELLQGPTAKGKRGARPLSSPSKGRAKA